MAALMIVNVLLICMLGLSQGTFMKHSVEARTTENCDMTYMCPSFCLKMVDNCYKCQCGSSMEQFMDTSSSKLQQEYRSPVFQTGSLVQNSMDSPFTGSGSTSERSDSPMNAQSISGYNQWQSGSSNAGSPKWIGNSMSWSNGGSNSMLSSNGQSNTMMSSNIHSNGMTSGGGPFGNGNMIGSNMFSPGTGSAYEAGGGQQTGNIGVFNQGQYAPVITSYFEPDFKEFYSPLTGVMPGKCETLHSNCPSECWKINSFSGCMECACTKRTTASTTATPEVTTITSTLESTEASTTPQESTESTSLYGSTSHSTDSTTDAITSTSLSSITDTSTSTQSTPDETSGIVTFSTSKKFEKETTGSVLSTEAQPTTQKPSTGRDTQSTLGTTESTKDAPSTSQGPTSGTPSSTASLNPDNQTTATTSLTQMITQPPVQNKDTENTVAPSGVSMMNQEQENVSTRGKNPQRLDNQDTLAQLLEILGNATSDKNKSRNGSSKAVSVDENLNNFGNSLEIPSPLMVHEETTDTSINKEAIKCPDIPKECHGACVTHDDISGCSFCTCQSSSVQEMKIREEINKHSEYFGGCLPMADTCNESCISLDDRACPVCQCDHPKDLRKDVISPFTEDNIANIPGQNPQSVSRDCPAVTDGCPLNCIQLDPNWCAVCTCAVADEQLYTKTKTPEVIKIFAGNDVDKSSHGVQTGVCPPLGNQCPPGCEGFDARSFCPVCNCPLQHDGQ